MKIPKSYFNMYYDIIEASPEYRIVVEECMSEHQRHYHTMDHIALMLGNMSLYSLRKSKIHATFMHDIVYDPKKTDNEERSSDYAWMLYKDTNLTSEEMKLAEEMILASKSHKIVEGMRQATVDFIEADLSIFSEKPAIYHWYMHGIRKEYAHVPFEIYAPKRIEILEEILMQPSVWDRNISWEIDLLEQGKDFING